MTSTCSSFRFGGRSLHGAVVCFMLLSLTQYCQSLSPLSQRYFVHGPKGVVVPMNTFLFSQKSDKNVDEDVILGNTKHNDDRTSSKTPKTAKGKIEKTKGGVKEGEDDNNAQEKINAKANSMNVTQAENSTSASSSTNSSSSNSSSHETTEMEKVIGIGGQGGIVYDVNRLKKNLVQETVREYKRELMELLGTPFATESVIEDKLAALVQANPVSCTTDSNLLDGLWAYAFGSYTAAADMLLDSSRFLLSNKRKREQELMMNLLSSSSSNAAAATIAPQPILRLRPGTAESPFRSVTRQFNLEDLKDDEDAYVMDQTKFVGGLFSKTRRYNVMSLTRTSLQLDIAQSQTRLLGKRLWERQYAAAQRKPLELQILYLDGDLCVSTSQEGGPFHVYTKSDDWMEGSRTRKVRYSVAVLRVIQKYLVGVINCRKQVYKLFSRLRQRGRDNGDDMDDANLMMTERKMGDDTTLKVLKLGDLDNDNHAWEGEEDPFVHLTADERQQKLRELRVRDIIGEKQRQDRKMKRKKKRPPIFQRKMPFKKPDKK